MALGRIGVRDATDRLLEMARDDGPSDPLLRHAAVMGLAGSATVQDNIEMERLSAEIEAEQGSQVRNAHIEMYVNLSNAWFLNDEFYGNRP